MFKQRGDYCSLQQICWEPTKGRAGRTTVSRVNVSRTEYNESTLNSMVLRR